MRGREVESAEGIRDEGSADGGIYQPNRPLSVVPFGRKGGLPGRKCTEFLAKDIALVSDYQEPRPNMFNHASVTGVTPSAVRVEEAATLKVRSHDADTLAPTRELVVDRIDSGRLGFAGRSLIRFHRAQCSPPRTAVG